MKAHEMRIWTKETDKIFFEMWGHCEPDEIAKSVNNWLGSYAKSKGYGSSPVTTARGVMYHALKHGLILQSDVDAFDKHQKMERAKRQYVSVKVREEILERDGKKCLLCGNQIDLRVVHITPVSRGGNNNPENLQTLCVSCHKDTRLSGTDFRKPYIKLWCENCQREHYKNIK